MADQAFVGRQAQMHALGDALAQALIGESVICMVVGEPGAGKTTLLRHFAEEAQRNHTDLLVAYGACNSFTGTGDAYLPFREILRLLTGDVAQSVAEGRADAENASRLQSFVRMSGRALVENGPDLIDIFVPGGALLARLGGKAARRFSWAERLTQKVMEQPSGPVELGQENVFEQYSQVLEAMAAEHPLMLIVDDLHWADKASLGLMFHLARRLVNDRVFIVGAYRNEDLAQAEEHQSRLRSVLAELKRIYGHIVIDLEEVAARAFVDAVIDTRRNRLGHDFREALTRHTAGNPLFITELLQHLDAEGTLGRDADGCLVLTRGVDWSELPARVAGVIEARLSHLTEAQREILEVASVQGDEFSAETVSRITGEPRRRIVRELSGQLQREHGIVTALGVRNASPQPLSVYRFRHNLFRHYLYQGLDHIERMDLHGEVGSALEQLAADDLPRMSTQLARHFREARQWGKAIGYCVMAADYADMARAPEEVISQLRLALALWRDHGAAAAAAAFDPASAMETLADQLLLAGRYDGADEWYARALEEFGNDELGRCRIMRKRTAPFQRKGEFETALSTLREAAGRLEQVRKDPPERWWREWLDIEQEFCWIHYWRNEPEQLRARLEQMLPVASEWGTAKQRLTCSQAEARLRLRSARYRTDAALVAALRGASEQSGDDADNANNAFLLGFVELWSQQYEAAVATLESARELAQRAGDIVNKARATTYLTVAHRYLHHREQIAALIPHARELAGFVNAADYLGVVVAQEAWLAWSGDDREAAAAKADEALGIWEERSPNYPFQWLALWVKLALAAQERAWEPMLAATAAKLEASQMRQPPAIERQLSRVLKIGGDRDAERLRREVAIALDLACEEGLL